VQRSRGREAATDLADIASGDALIRNTTPCAGWANPHLENRERLPTRLWFAAALHHSIFSAAATQRLLREALTVIQVRTTGFCLHANRVAVYSPPL